MKLPFRLFALCLVFACSAFALAQDEPKQDEPAQEEPKQEEPKQEDPSAEPAKPEVQDVIRNLYNPTGVAVQPDTGDVFIADSGNLRILRYHMVGMRMGLKPKAVVTGFPKDVYGKGPMYDIGPLGLGFMKKNLLVVGDGGNVDGKELLRVYDLPDDGTLKADDAKFSLGPIGPPENAEEANKGEGNFYAVAVTADAIYVTSNGDDNKGWVNRAEVKDFEPSNFTTFLATKEKVGVDAPVGITISPDGNLVVGQMGEINVPGDSLLTVYDPKTGDLKLKAETGLDDIAAVAYNPKKPDDLYALDFGWMDDTRENTDEKKGGLYKLVVSGEGDAVKVTPEKIVAFDKPTAMAFDTEGNLYVTLIGTAKEGEERKPGLLVRVVGL